MQGTLIEIVAGRGRQAGGKGLEHSGREGLSEFEDDIENPMRIGCVQVADEGSGCLEVFLVHKTSHPEGHEGREVSRETRGSRTEVLGLHHARLRDIEGFKPIRVIPGEPSLYRYAETYADGEDR